MVSEFGPQLKFPSCSALGHPIIETTRNEAREKMVTRKMMCLLQLKDKHNDTKNDTAIVVCYGIGIGYENARNSTGNENNATTTYTDDADTKL